MASFDDKEIEKKKRAKGEIREGNHSVWPIQNCDSRDVVIMICMKFG